jgi:hypothetical protein
MFARDSIKQSRYAPYAHKLGLILAPLKESLFRVPIYLVLNFSGKKKEKKNQEPSATLVTQR